MPDISQDINPAETLISLLNTEDPSKVETFLARLSPGDEARALSQLNKEQQERLFTLLGSEKSAQVLQKITGRGVVSVIEQMPLAQATDIFEEMSGRQQVDTLRRLKEKDAERIIETFAAPRAEKLMELIAYPEDTAGGLMIPEYLAFSKGMLVRDVLDDLREHGEIYSDYAIQYAYVVAEAGRLLGVLRLRDLLLAPKSKPLTDIMIKDPQNVRVDASLKDLKEFFKQYNYLGVPVVDVEERLVGVVLAAAVRDAANKRSNQIFLQFPNIIGGDGAPAQTTCLSLFPWEDV